jgi:hypothetical protein
MATYYRVTIPALATNRQAAQPTTDGNLLFDCYVEVDLLGDDHWTPAEGSSHFTVVLPASAVTAIDSDPLNTTPAKKRKALQVAIVAADARLSAIKQADVAYRQAVNWLNLATGAESWNL